DQVLGTPDMIRTHFETPGLPAAKEDVRDYTHNLQGVPTSVTTRFYTIHENKLDNGGHSPSGSGGGDAGFTASPGSASGPTLPQRLLAASASRAVNTTASRTSTVV